MTFIAGGAHSVQVASRTSLALAAGDLFTLAIPVVGTARAGRTLAADVISIAVS